MKEFDDIIKIPKKEKEYILKMINQDKWNITLRDWLLVVAHDWDNGRAYELQLNEPLNLKKELKRK